MQLEESELHLGNRLVADYLQDYARVESYFEYDPFAAHSWSRRCQWLKEHPLQHRSVLAEGLKRYNQQLNNHPAVMENIEKLRQEDSFVVIGGQQAGILTGPLYVIHKAVTLLKLAQQARRETGCEVIPVFWIASEDHDFDEVNHLYLFSGDQPKKLKLPFTPGKKQSISEMDIPNEAFCTIVEEVCRCLFDQPHQAAMKDKLLSLAKASYRLNDFFARVLAWLFGEFGLVLVDSADPFVRELEKPVFRELIRHDFNPDLLAVQDSLLASGYRPQLDIREDQAHFFVILEQERQLMYKAEGSFLVRNGSVRFSEEEMERWLEQSPGAFSANVVSRPVMQEHLFPVLAFVGGPGEIAYWAQLKPVFKHFRMQMPIVFPRITVTFVERDVEKYLRGFQQAIPRSYQEVTEFRAAWLKTQTGFYLEQDFAELKKQLEAVYLPFVRRLAELEPGVRNLGESNMGRILAHVDFLQKRTAQAIELRHQAGLRQWKRIENSLYPLEKPQERVYNVFDFLNRYGMDLISDMMELPIPLNRKHKLLYI